MSCVYTSVDDPVTFDSDASRAALRRLQAAHIPVIPVTVMTLEQIEPLARALGFRHAMIVESGGGIARWTGGRWEVEACGPTADTLLDVIGRIEEIAGARLLVYSALPEREAARFGVSTQRCFSEPFVIESGDVAAVMDAASSLGFSVRRGPRFFHLCRSSDEGEAFARIREELRCELSVAIGSTPLDAAFLARADVAVIIPDANGADPELLARVPHARVAPAPGPAGWAAAIDGLWRELTASRAARRRPSSATARTEYPSSRRSHAPTSRTSGSGS